MNILGIHAELLFQPVLNDRQSLEALAAGVGHFDHYLGEPLTPLLKEDERLFANADLDLFLERGMTFTACHEPTGKILGESPWLVSFHLLSFPTPSSTVLQMLPSLTLPNDKSVLAVSDFVSYALLKFAEAANPTLAVANGFNNQPEDYLPSIEKLRPGMLPSFFPPWLYLGSDRLTPERRQWLSSLPAFSSKPLGQGWYLQAVPNLLTPPTNALLSALRSNPGGKPVRYHQIPALPDK